MEARTDRRNRLRAGRGVAVAWRRLLVAALLAAGPAAAQVEVTFLANEGFLLSAGETRVLVDALFGDGIAGYPAVPEEIRRDLEGGAGRFAGVDLVLASHHHGDHFDPQAVARFLRAQPTARFVSTPQAVERLRQAAPGDALAGRAEGIWPPEGERVSLELGDDLRLSILNLHHGRGRRPEVQNLGFVIELGGLRVLHIGDTEASAEEFRAYDLDGVGIDVGLLPAWQVEGSVLAEIRPRHLVAMHLASPDAPPYYFGAAGSLERRVADLRATGDIWVPLEPLASRRFALE